jgi:hypothetical protein
MLSAMERLGVVERMRGMHMECILHLYARLSLMLPQCPQPTHV